MTIRWIGCASQNFGGGRPAGLPPSAIVLHRSGGSLNDLRARFADPTSSLSAHYVVGGARPPELLETWPVELGPLPAGAFYAPRARVRFGPRLPRLRILGR